MLFLVGIGLENGDISSKAMEVIGKADALLLDQYTNFTSSDEVKKLGEIIGKDPKPLQRSDLEENVKKTIEAAMEKNVVILVPGDPLIATTHHTIIDAAKKMGIPYRIIHGISVFSAAIGESGLDIYKFGPTATIPFWTEKYKPVSFIDVVAQNVKNKEHTLILLDYNYKEKMRMELAEAIKLLHKADEITGHNLIKKETKIIILGNVGKETQVIRYLPVDGINKEVLKEFLDKTICLIFPTNLNFAEEDALLKFGA